MRLTWPALLALTLLAADASFARADMPPGGWRGESRVSRPFRSCDSGMGAGLAGIALTWGALWFGHRVAKRDRTR